MIKPASPTEDTMDLIRGNAKNWSYNTQVILEEPRGLQHATVEVHRGREESTDDLLIHCLGLKKTPFESKRCPTDTLFFSKHFCGFYFIIQSILFCFWMFEF